MDKKLKISFLSFLLFLILGITLKAGDFLKRLDLNLSLSFYDKSFCQNKLFWTIITTFANKEVIIPATILFLIIFFWQKKKKYALFFFLIISFSEIIKEFFKFIFHRQRPTINQLIAVSSKYSFPSGHTLIFFVFIFFAFLPFLVKTENRNKKNVYLFIWIVSATIIGLSRICLGVHWPFDILGSFLLGISIVEAGLYFLKRYD